MPKKAKELSALEVKRLNKEGFHAVGGVAGLQLQVTETGAKSWVLRTMIGGKRRHLGLGAYPEVTLADAKDKARLMKASIEQGVDPIAEKQAQVSRILAEQLKIKTFKEVALQFIAKQSKEFKETSRAKQVQRLENSLSTYAYPILGELNIATIEKSHILQVLNPIWETKTATADRLRCNIERILHLSIIHGYRDDKDNPAAWENNLSAILPSPQKIAKTQHFESLEVDNLPAFMIELKKRKGFSARALEFAILTASRSLEVRGATWAEIDLENALWIIPAERMKMGKRHTVPLSQPAIDLLKALPRLAESPYLFPSPSNTQLSENGMLSLLKKMDAKVTQHGFRSTFKDWCRRYTNYSDELSELALAHVNSDSTRAAYARDELIDKRRLLMADWGNFCGTI